MSKEDEGIKKEAETNPYARIKIQNEGMTRYLALVLAVWPGRGFYCVLCNYKGNSGVYIPPYLSFPHAFIFISSSLYVCALSCAQVSTRWPGGENPSYSPECLQHGYQSGTDTAKQYGARKRYSIDYHYYHWCVVSHSTFCIHEYII